MIRMFLFIVGISHGVSAADETQLLNLPETDEDRLPRTERVWPASSDRAHVCLWRDDKLAAFSITIDDNNRPPSRMGGPGPCKSSLTARPVMMR